MTYKQRQIQTHKQLKIITLIVLVLLINISSVSALSILTNSSLNINSRHKENLILIANDINITRSVDGDLLFASNILNIYGKVNGDLLGSAGQINIYNEVKGDVRVAAGELRILNKISGDVVTGTGTLIIGKNAIIEGDVISYGGNIEILGVVKGNVLIKGGSVKINNTIKGNLNVEAGKVELGPAAVINGNLTYRTNTQLKIRKNSVHGRIIFKEYKKQEIYHMLSSKFNSILMLIMVMVVFIALFENTSKKAVDKIKLSPETSLGVGILVLIVVPIFALFLALTIIGLPLALIIGGVYVLFIYLSNGLMGLWLGENITKKFMKSPSLYLSAVIGIFILSSLELIPGVGGIIKLFSICIGVGALSLILKELFRKKKRRQDNLNLP